MNSPEIAAVVSVVSPRLASALAILPFWTSAVVRAYAWRLALGRRVRSTAR